MTTAFTSAFHDLITECVYRSKGGLMIQFLKVLAVNIVFSIVAVIISGTATLLSRQSLLTSP
jgi:hypothetical protein